MQWLARHVFFLAIALSFLSAIFLLPLLSFVVMIYSSIWQWWTVWHAVPIVDMLVVAFFIHYIGPAFDRKKIEPGLSSN